MTNFWFIGYHTFVDRLTEEEVAYRWPGLWGGYRNDTMTHRRLCIVENGTFGLLLNKDNAAIHASVSTWTQWLCCLRRARKSEFGFPVVSSAMSWDWWLSAPWCLAFGVQDNPHKSKELGMWLSKCKRYTHNHGRAQFVKLMTGHRVWAMRGCSFWFQRSWGLV